MNWRGAWVALPPAVESVLLTIWIGGLWFAGLVAAPRLFQIYPSELAGDVAGMLFTLVFWIGLPAMALLALRILKARTLAQPWRLDLALVGSLLLVSLVNELVLHPAITQLRMTVSHGTSFVIAHGASSLLYLLACLLGVALVIRRRGSV